MTFQLEVWFDDLLNLLVHQRNSGCKVADVRLKKQKFSKNKYAKMKYNQKNVSFKHFKQQKYS